jgi:hypothetical protein
MPGAMFESEGTGDDLTAGIEPAILPLLDRFESGDPVLQLDASLLQFVDTLRAWFSRHERTVFIRACKSARPYITLNFGRQNPKSSKPFSFYTPLNPPKSCRNMTESAVVEHPLMVRLYAPERSVVRSCHPAKTRARGARNEEMTSRRSGLAAGAKGV